MSQTQVAVNAAATRNLAARLERSGYTGDAMAEAEAIVVNLLADGLAPVTRPEPIPPRGNGGSPGARAAALTATADAVAAAKTRRQSPAAPEPTVSPRQLTKLAIALSEDGIKDRAERLAWAGAMVGRDLTSTSELTAREAHRLIDSLEAPRAADEPPTDDELAYSPQMLEDNADAMEAAVLAARDQADDDPDDQPPSGEVLDDDGFGEQWQIEQTEWADTEPDPSYVYAGGSDAEPPF